MKFHQFLQYIKSHPVLIYALIFIILIIILLLPFQVHYTIKAPGRIMPARELIVSKGLDGRFMAELVNNKTGMSKIFFTTQIERGDIIQFTLKDNIAAGTAIFSGDTIGYITSNDTHRELVNLNNAIETEKSSLKLYSTGEKQSVIDEAKDRLDFAKKQLEEERKIYLRQKALFERDLISQQEYEISLGTTNLYEINVEIAASQLLTVQSGAKSEQIEYIRSRINSLQNEIQILREKSSLLQLISPISGIVFRTFSADTLLTIGDTSEYIVIMPVKWWEREYIENTQRIEVKISNVSDPLYASLEYLDMSIHMIKGNQIMFATASINQNTNKLAPGLSAECSIVSGDITLREYLTRIINSMFN